MTGGRGARNARLFEKMWARRADEAGQARARRRIRRKRKWAQRELMPTSVNILAELLRSRDQALTA